MSHTMPPPPKVPSLGFCAISTATLAAPPPVVEVRRN